MLLCVECVIIMFSVIMCVKLLWYLLTIITIFANGARLQIIEKLDILENQSKNVYENQTKAKFKDQVTFMYLHLPAVGQTKTIGIGHVRNCGRSRVSYAD